MGSALYAKEFKVGVLYWSMNIEGQVIMRYGLEQKAKEINKLAATKNLPQVKLISYIAGDGADGIDNQVVQFTKLIKRKVDLIIVQPTDNAALSLPLRLANREKIPVIAYDQYIVGGRLASFITSNNYQAGYLDGEYIASLFSEDYKIRLILVEYPNVSSTIDRVDGFFDALKRNKQKYKIIKSYKAVEPVGGRKVAKEILQDFPTKGSIDVIFTINDGGGLPIVQILSEAGRKEIKIATIDGDPASVKNIINGKLTVIDSAQFCAEIGRQSIAAAYSYLLGKPIPRKILIPTFPITRETLKRYPGWKGKIPKRFIKPWAKKSYWNNKFKISNTSYSTCINMKFFGIKFHFCNTTFNKLNINFFICPIM